MIGGLRNFRVRLPTNLNAKGICLMMINKSIILFTFLAVTCLFGCSRYDINDVQGDWISWDSLPSEFPFQYFKISGDSIYLQDDFNCQIGGVVEVGHNSLQIRISESENYQLGIRKILQDSLLGLDSIIFSNYPYGHDWNRIDFDFIDVPGNKVGVFSYPHRVIWLSHEKGRLKINVGEKYIDLEEIQDYLYVPYRHQVRESRKPLVETIFIGQGVELKDLQILFEYSLLYTVTRVRLITKRNRGSQYQGISLKIESWEENLEKLIVEGMIPDNLPPRPPPLPDAYKADVLKTGAREFKIGNSKDLLVLSMDSSAVATILTIDREVTMRDYIDIQLSLKQLREIYSGRIYCVIE